MSDYSSRIPNFVEGKTEEEVRQKLLLVSEQMKQKIEIMSIYHNASKNRIFAWYFHDIRQAPLPKNETAKKKTRKKLSSKGE